MQRMIESSWLGWRGSMAALLAGMALPLAFSPFNFYPVAILSLSVLFIAWHNVDAKQAAWRGFLFGYGMFAVGISWIYVAIHDFGNASMPLAAFLTGLFAAFLALYIALLAWLLKRVAGRNQLLLPDYLLLLPVAWLFFEWFKGWFLTGFPWLEVGTSQVSGPLSGYTPVIGSLGVSLLVAFSAGLLSAAWQFKKGALVIVMAVLWLGGYSLNTTTWTYASDKPLRVSLIQGNVPQEIKWDKEQVLNTLALYQQKTEENWQSDLIVWPENAVTVFYHQAKKFYIDPLASLARQNNSDILVGLPVLDETTNQYYNSMMSLGSKEAFYHKRHLVPFGDYIPIEWLRGLIAFFDLPMSSFSAGGDQQALLEAAGQKIGVSVCYEDTFSTEVLDTLPEASLLVNATNNAWYGDSFAPHQHLQISQNRALETGRPVLRATTNGISALIDHKGQLLATSTQFEQAVVTGMIEPRQGSTPYVRWQQWPLLLLSLVMLLLWGYHRQNNLSKQTS